MTANRSLFRKRRLRWPLLLALAVVLVIALMIDYSLRPRREVFIHLGIGLFAAGLVFLLPPLRNWRRPLIELLLLLPPAALLIIAHANISAVWASRGLLFSDADQVPPARVGLVFGTTDRVQGRENLYFRYRIDAAERLWKAGKIDTLIVSGDNRSDFYNEPLRMRQALTERGIPADRIVADYAGLRTLDSVVRAKEIFGAEPVVFISQRFQNERAIYLAKAHGIKAFGYNARDVHSHAGLKTKFREIGARVKMWLDVHFLKTRPRHLGQRESLPEPKSRPSGHSPQPRENSDGPGD